MTLEFEQLATELRDDPDRDVSVVEDSLLAHGIRFAYLDGRTLLVRLPASRAFDLAAREIAASTELVSDDGYRWVRVPDIENWSELAREAHESTQQHRPGGQS